MLPLPIMSQHSILSSYGDIVELDYQFGQDTIDELKSVSNWIAAPNGKTGINLTGPIEDLGLNSDPKLKHAEHQEYNENLLACPSIKTFFDKWTNLARCRAVTMNKGSYFALHRDAFRMNNQFRIFIPLNKTNDNEWAFMYDDRLARFKAGRPYILNTRKQHGSFAMANGIYHILMSVYLNQDNLKTIASMLPNCEDH